MVIAHTSSVEFASYQVLLVPPKLYIQLYNNEDIFLGRTLLFVCTRRIMCISSLYSPNSSGFELTQKSNLLNLVLVCVRIKLCNDLKRFFQPLRKSNILCCDASNWEKIWRFDQVIDFSLQTENSSEIQLDPFLLVNVIRINKWLYQLCFIIN